MTIPLSTDKGLLAGLREALAANLEGLTELELRRYLVEKLGLRRTPAEVRQGLISFPDLFVSLADGRWRLQSALEADEIAKSQRPLPRERGEIVIPYLAEFPTLENVIVFDLETTG